MTEGISQEARALFRELERYAVAGRDYSPILDDEAVELIETAMQSLINSTIERCAAVAESSGPFTGCNPAFVGDYIATAIRQMKGSTNV